MIHPVVKRSCPAGITVVRQGLGQAVVILLNWSVAMPWTSLVFMRSNLFMLLFLSAVL